jgi:2-dehydro-3-deoxyphosphogluconate aldolase / (4S)-4-hydroxy-2-oxoglutarate aldolase
MTHVVDRTEARLATGLARSRLIALASLDSPHQAETVGAALLRGGIACLELDGPVNVQQLRGARRVEGLLVGAGRVHTPEQVEDALRGGAHFATASATNMAVVHACREADLPFFPGVATPSEVERLALLGVRTLRLFPAGPLGGPAYLQAVADPYPDMRFIPAGGIGPEALRGYLNLRCVLAVAAGGLVRPEHLRARNLERVEWLASEAVRAGRPTWRPPA